MFAECLEHEGETGKDQINIDEIKHPIDSFKTFNEFFTRELKSGARPIAYEDHDDIAICAATFKSVFRVIEALVDMPGSLYMVNPIAVNRSITFIKKKGDYIHKGDEFRKFSFVGSIVSCMSEKDSIDLDKDLIVNSERSLETLVSIGMTT
ncbi:phosphatidylserine decarboxylase proenzyme 2-like [Dendrobium catenatum]|uniref:phosphatidylserine decarboxylase proenzyme 2-like n=1 Tax=Dendrobium catenatum TaxID=906689 RepID=UPI0009F29EC0|nr:phosphatidylserine decarboxylase proenzyme 2-like [Dendrobium catenatum]